MTDLIIELKHTLIVKHILDLLILNPDCQPVLSDGVCLLHLAIVVGHKLEKSDYCLHQVMAIPVSRVETLIFYIFFSGVSENRFFTQTNNFRFIAMPSKMTRKGAYLTFLGGHIFPLPTSYSGKQKMAIYQPLSLK